MISIKTRFCSRQQWVKKLDALARQVITTRDKVCVRCGKTEGLAVAHCYPKGRYTRMRWELDNLLLLCYACHICWWHRNPIEAGQWFKDKFPDRYLWLRRRSQINDKSKIDYLAQELYLTAELKKYAL